MQVFLITGGLGRIGLSLARSLLQFVPDSRVVITTRAAMPPQSQWDAIVSQAGDACAPAAEVCFLNGDWKHPEGLAKDSLLECCSVACQLGEWAPTGML